MAQKKTRRYERFLVRGYLDILVYNGIFSSFLNTHIPKINIGSMSLMLLFHRSIVKVSSGILRCFIYDVFIFVSPVFSGL